MVVAQLLAGTPAADARLPLDLSLDVRVFGYALALSLAAGVFFGLAPALQFTRPDLAMALKEEGSSFGRQADAIALARLPGGRAGGRLHAAADYRRPADARPGAVSQRRSRLRHTAAISVSG